MLEGSFTFKEQALIYNSPSVRSPCKAGRGDAAAHLLSYRE